MSIIGQLISQSKIRSLERKRIVKEIDKMIKAKQRYYKKHYDLDNIDNLIRPLVELKTKLKEGKYVGSTKT